MDPTHITVVAGTDALAEYEALVASMAVPSTRALRCWESESLCRAQVEARRRGYEGAELVPAAYGWSVREAAFDKRVLAGTRRGEHVDGTYDAAIAWATAWAGARPGLRWAFVRLAYLSKKGGEL